MSREVIRKAQLAQLKIMDQIHKVCEKKSMKYYIIGGTALGVVRHAGFIPWDPDIDIAMPRPDYDRFLKECENEMQPVCSIKCYSNDANHYAPHALVVLNGSSLKNRYDKYNNEKKSIYVDIFPLDVAPNDIRQQNNQAKKIKLIKNLIERKRSVIYDHNGLAVRWMKHIVRGLFSVVSYRYLCKILDENMKKYSYPYPTGNYFLCSMASHYSYKKQCMPSDVYGIPTLYEFENYKFFGPQKIEEYLTRLYKDYMKLPPKEEQDRWFAYLESIEID